MIVNNQVAFYTLSVDGPTIIPTLQEYLPEIPTVWRNYYYSKDIVLHTQEGVDLTEPDRADSIEQMLARRAAGLPETFTAMNVRPFPTDPNSVKTAAKLLKEFQDAGKQELEHLKEARKVEVATAKVAAKAAAKEQEEFEQFKAQKAQNSPK